MKPTQNINSNYSTVVTISNRIPHGFSFIRGSEEETHTLIVKKKMVKSHLQLV